MSGQHRVDPGCQAYQAFVSAYLGHKQDAAGRLAAFIEADPADPRGPAARAILLATLARSELAGPSRASASEATRLLAEGAFSPSDRAFVDAAWHASEGLWLEAIAALDRATRLDPSDTLSIKMSHALRFMLGDVKGMLGSIEQSLAHLPRDHDHRGFLLGCHAFALEENGHYVEAERAGRKAIQLRPDDAWGLHAIGHVYEMTGRVDDGIRLIEEHETTIRGANNFGGHLFWHLALFRLEQGDIAEAMALYDREVRREATDDFRDIANAASLLMRIELLGHPVGNRWEELADKAENRIDDRSLLFADLHYILALMGAGRLTKAQKLAKSMQILAPRSFAQEPAWRQAGMAIGAGLSAFMEGDMSKAYSCLADLKSPAQLIGGSHAQRDILEQITIEAGLRAGADGELSARLSRRMAMRSGANRFAETRLAMLATKARPRRGLAHILAALAGGRDPIGHHA